VYCFASRLSGHDRRTIFTTSDRVRLSRMQNPIPNPPPPFFKPLTFVDLQMKATFQQAAGCSYVLHKRLLRYVPHVETIFSQNHNFRGRLFASQKRGPRSKRFEKRRVKYRLENVKLHLDRLKLRVLQPQIQ